jgi:hypothetical protein
VTRLRPAPGKDFGLAGRLCAGAARPDQGRADEKHVAADSSLAQFVGLQPYEEAGGNAEIRRGLIKQEDKAAARTADKARNAADSGANGEASPSGLSAALVEDLTAYRTAALQARLADNPKIALVAVVFMRWRSNSTSRREPAAWCGSRWTWYFGRVSKQQTLDAVAEGVTREAADNLAKLKKADLAKEAEKKLAGTGWFPAILRAAWQ